MALELPAAEVPPRRIDEIRAALSDEDRATLDAWLADPKVSASRIALALSAEGHTLSDWCVKDWRRRAR